MKKKVVKRFRLRRETLLWLAQGAQRTQVLPGNDDTFTVDLCTSEPCNHPSGTRPDCALTERFSQCRTCMEDPPTNESITFPGA